MFFKRYKKNYKSTQRKYKSRNKTKQFNHSQRTNNSFTQRLSDKEYYDKLMQKFNKYGYLSSNEMMWLENNAHRFDY